MRCFSFHSPEKPRHDLAREVEPSLPGPQQRAQIGSGIPSEPSPLRALKSDAADTAKRHRAEADKALLLACLSGGEIAFSALYTRLAPSLFSAVFAIVRNQKDAEDVMQEAFVQMWNKAAAYDAQRGSVFTWSMMIARSKAIDRVRAQERRTRLGEAAALEQETAFPDSPKSADELHTERDERARIRAALGAISDTQRVAIDLAFFSGLTQVEISARLGMPLGTVKARIRRGLVALREELAAA